MMSALNFSMTWPYTGIPSVQFNALLNFLTITLYLPWCVNPIPIEDLRCRLTNAISFRDFDMSHSCNNQQSNIKTLIENYACYNIMLGVWTPEMLRVAKFDTSPNSQLIQCVSKWFASVEPVILAELNNKQATPQITEQLAVPQQELTADESMKANYSSAISFWKREEAAAKTGLQNKSRSSLTRRAGTS